MVATWGPLDFEYHPRPPPSMCPPFTVPQPSVVCWLVWEVAVVMEVTDLGLQDFQLTWRFFFSAKYSLL